MAIRKTGEFKRTPISQKSSFTKSALKARRPNITKKIVTPNALNTKRNLINAFNNPKIKMTGNSPIKTAFNNPKVRLPITRNKPVQPKINVSKPKGVPTNRQIKTGPGGKPLSQMQRGATRKRGVRRKRAII